MCWVFAVIGAVLGSMIAPCIGTIGGAVLGYIIGAAIDENSNQTSGNNDGGSNHKAFNTPQSTHGNVSTERTRFEFRIAGVTYPNDDGTSRQMAISHTYKGSDLFLERDPHNRYDSNAVRVMNARREQIGFVPRDMAASISAAIERGGAVEARVIEVLGGTNGLNYGCSVEAWISSAENRAKQGDSVSTTSDSHSDYDYDDYGYSGYDPVDDWQPGDYRPDDLCDADPDVCCGYDH